MSFRDRFVALQRLLAEEVAKDLLDEDAAALQLEEAREIIKRRMGTEDLIDESFLSTLLTLSTFDSASSQHRQLLAESAVRAMMNALYENSTAIETFKTLHGPERVFRLIQLEVPVRTAYYGVKLLYMLFSSSPQNAVHLLALRSTITEMSFSEVVVATFTSCLHPAVDADRRDLFIDCAKLLYAIEHLYQNTSGTGGEMDKDLLPKLRSSEKTLLSMQRQVTSVLVKSTRDKNVYLCQLACLQLLLLADRKALQFLCSEGGEAVLEALVGLLRLLLAECLADPANNEKHLTTMLVLYLHITDIHFNAQLTPCFITGGAAPNWQGRPSAAAGDQATYPS